MLALVRLPDFLSLAACGFDVIFSYQKSCSEMIFNIQIMIFNIVVLYVIVLSNKIQYSEFDQ
jgi:hypothetical protein